MRKARADRDRRGAVWRKKAPNSPCRPCLRALLGPIPRPPGALAACLCTGREKENIYREKLTMMDGRSMGISPELMATTVVLKSASSRRRLMASN